MFYRSLLIIAIHYRERQIAMNTHQRLIALDSEKAVFLKALGMLYRPVYRNSPSYCSRRCATNVCTAFYLCRGRCTRQLEREKERGRETERERERKRWIRRYKPEECNFLATRSESIRRSVLGVSARSRASCVMCRRGFPPRRRSRIHHRERRALDPTGERSRDTKPGARERR